MKEQDKFKLGELKVSRYAFEDLDPDSVHACLDRHLRGDWGAVSTFDKLRNDEAAVCGDEQIISQFKDCNGRPFTVVTAADRRTTWVMLPWEL